MLYALRWDKGDGKILVFCVGRGLFPLEGFELESVYFLIHHQSQSLFTTNFVVMFYNKTNFYKGLGVELMQFSKTVDAMWRVYNFV